MKVSSVFEQRDNFTTASKYKKSLTMSYCSNPEEKISHNISAVKDINQLFEKIRCLKEITEKEYLSRNEYEEELREFKNEIDAIYPNVIITGNEYSGKKSLVEFITQINIFSNLNIRV